MRCMNTSAAEPREGGGRENRHQQRRHIKDRDIGLAGITDTAGDCRAPEAMHATNDTAGLPQSPAALF